MPSLTQSLTLTRHAVLLLPLVCLTNCSNQPPGGSEPCLQLQATTSAYDPAEPFNRSIFVFNRTVDKYALAPIARGYRHLPNAMQQGVHNFASNFGEPKVLINDLLQGNPQRSVNTLGRFAVNSTVGVLGLINISDQIGIPRHSADFGQTFGVWGIGNGPIIELPLLGTGNSRDSAGKVLGFFVDPFGDHSDTVQTLNTVATAGGIVDDRAALLPLTDSLEKLPDYYSALRRVVAEHRTAFVEEGKQGATEANTHCYPGAHVDDF